MEAKGPDFDPCRLWKIPEAVFVLWLEPLRAHLKQKMRSFEQKILALSEPGSKQIYRDLSAADGLLGKLPRQFSKKAAETSENVQKIIAEKRLNTSEQNQHQNMPNIVYLHHN